MHKIGVRKVYFFGILVTAFCAMAFGFLDFVTSKTTFLALSYTFRIFEGIAEAASWSAVRINFTKKIFTFLDKVCALSNVLHKIYV